MRKLTVLSVCVVLVFCFCFTSAAVASDEEEIIQMSLNAAIAMKTADYELMASLWLNSPRTTAYFPDAPFLYEGGESILDVWQSTCSLPAGTHAPTFHNFKVTMIDDDVAISTFYANHVYTDPTTKEQGTSPFRVTLVVQKTSGKWLCVHQHTSRLPVE